MGHSKAPRCWVIQDHETLTSQRGMQPGRLAGAVLRHLAVCTGRGKDSPGSTWTLLVLSPLAAAGPAPVHADVEATELVPAPPPTPSPALTSQQDPASGSPPPPAAELESWGLHSRRHPSERYLQAALDPRLPCPSVQELIIILLTAVLIAQRYESYRINVNKM